jgi:hypothetical protein
VNYGEMQSAEVNYKLIAKFAGTILFYHLNAVLKTDLIEGFEAMKINWCSYAIPKAGLLATRAVLTVNYTLLLFTTLVLFFQSNDLPDILLNCLAMEFLILFDLDFTKFHKVEHGIATNNDFGRKIFLSYIASGVDTNSIITENMQQKWVQKTLQIIGWAIACSYIWVFNCI